jgi:hypothetical protein
MTGIDCDECAKFKQIYKNYYYKYWFQLKY